MKKKKRKKERKKERKKNEKTNHMGNKRRKIKKKDDEVKKTGEGSEKRWRMRGWGKVEECLGRRRSRKGEGR